VSLEPIISPKLIGTRIFPAFIIFFCQILFHSDVAATDEKKSFEQNSLSIPTSQYGGFLIDRDGFIWIGTTGLGLLRYDGVELKSFADSVPGSMISTIVEDQQGLIWVASFSNGLTSYDKNKGLFTHYIHEIGNKNSLCSNNISFSPKKILIDQSNKLWVGTDDAGICIYDQDIDKWTQHLYKPNAINRLNDNTVLAVAEDQDGSIWVGTQHGGLNKFDPKTQLWSSYKHDQNDPNSLSSNWVSSLLVDSDGTLWAGTKNRGLNQFDPKLGTFKHFLHNQKQENSIGDNGVWNLNEDHNGGIWISHISSVSSGLDLFDKESGFFTRYQHKPEDPRSISTNAIVGVYDHLPSRTLWVINFNGRIDRNDESSSVFNNILSQPGSIRHLSNPTVEPIIEDSDHNIWVGTMGGLNRIEANTGLITHFLPDPLDPLTIPLERITALAEDEFGVLWIGFWDGILASFDREAGKVIEVYQHDADDSSSITENERIQYIHQDKDDSNILWLATMKGGLDRFDQRSQQFTHFKSTHEDLAGISKEQPSYNSMASLYDDGKGSLWVPTYGAGLDIFDKKTKTFKNYRKQTGNPESLAFNVLYEVIETTAGQIWMSAKGGISRFDPENEVFENFEKDSNDVRYGAVGSLLEDDFGDLWLGSLGGGLVRFNPIRKTTKRYTVEDGLQSNINFWGSRLKTSSGSLWFGNSIGITHFQPSRLKENAIASPVFLTSFTQGGEKIDLGASPERMKQVTLDWRTNYFEFQFAALNFIAPGNNQYTYKLEGWDDYWYDAGKKPFGRYSGLPPGTYTLRMRGSNNDGVWAKEETSVVIIIEPPFWNTIWFYCLIALALLSIFAAILFYIVKMNKEEKRRMKTDAELSIQSNIINNITEGAVLVRARDGIILYVNLAFESMFSYDSGELHSKHISVVNAPVPEGETETDKNIISSLENDGVWRGEVHNMKKDGTQFWCTASVTTFHHSAHGDIWISIHTDITEQNRQLKHNKELLTQMDKVNGQLVDASISALGKEKELQELLDSILDAVVTIDEDGQILSFNKSAEKQFAYEAKDILGKNITLLIPEKYANNYEEYIEKNIQAGLPLAAEAGRDAEGKKRSGEIFPIRASLLELPRFGSEKRRFIATSQDVTQLKQQEELLERTKKMDALGKLTGGISHDFNNILGVIIGYSDLLKEVIPEDSELAGYVNQIKRAGDRGSNLTRRLSSFSRKDSTDSAQLNINEVLHLQQDLLQRSLTVRIKLLLDLQDEVWPVWLNRNDLENSILNLSINAMHAMENMTSGACLTISTTNHLIDQLDAEFLDLSAGEYIQLCISDTGCGIENAHKEKLFDPFFSTKGEKGSGLGLSQVFGFVKRASGTIRVYSELGHGSKFVLYFPRHTGTTDTPSSIVPLTHTKGVESILIVDDEEPLRKLASTLLQRQGYRTFSANGGPQALQILDQEHIDLLLSDVVMPDMDGYQLATIVNEKFPHIKIQLTSGYSDDKHLDYPKKNWHGLLIHKPYHAETLYKAIRDLLNKGK